jgi:hypothetical protein
MAGQGADSGGVQRTHFFEAQDELAGGAFVEARLPLPFLIILGVGFVAAACSVLAVVATTRPFYARYWLIVALAVFSIVLFGYATGRYIHRCAREVRVSADGVRVRSWSGKVFSSTWQKIDWVRMNNSAQRAGVPVMLWLRDTDGQQFALAISRGRLLPVHERILAEARAQSVTIRPTRNG